MKILHWILLITLIGSSTWLIIKTGDIEPLIEKNIDLNWRFILDDDDQFSDIAFDDSNWEIVTLPHTWRSDNQFGWYRKQLDLSSYEGKNQFYLIFEGLAENSHIWVNEQEVKHKLEHNTIQVDISNFIRKDSLNVIALRAEKPFIPQHKKCSEGGIYRHVKFIATEPLHFPVYSTKISSSIDSTGVKISAEIKLVNNYKKGKHLKVRSDFLAPDGSLIRSIITSRYINGNSSLNIVEHQIISHATYWTPDSPKQYEIRSFLIHKKKVTDHLITQFGIKNINLSSDSCCFLNGEKYNLNIAQLHNDNGIFSAAISDVTWEYRLNQLKKLGINAIIFNNFPPSPDMENMFERLGFLLMNDSLDSAYLSTHNHYLENNLLENSGEIKPFAYYIQSKQQLEPIIKLAVVEPDKKNLAKKTNIYPWAKIKLHRHWNFKDNPQEKQIVVFTNCENIEIQLNDNSVQHFKKSEFNDGVIKMLIPWYSGTIRASGYNTDSISVRDSLMTAGPPSIILMESDKDQLISNGIDVMHIKTRITDSTGITNPNANHLINYTVEGPGQFKFLDEHEKNKKLSASMVKKVRNGSHLLIVQSTIEPGDIIISAKAEGLKSTQLKVKSASPK